MTRRPKTGQHMPEAIPIERAGTFTLLLLWSAAVVAEKLLAFRRKSA